MSTIGVCEQKYKNLKRKKKNKQSLDMAYDIFVIFFTIAASNFNGMVTGYEEIDRGKIISYIYMQSWWVECYIEIQEKSIKEPGIKLK